MGYHITPSSRAKPPLRLKIEPALREFALPWIDLEQTDRLSILHTDHADPLAFTASGKPSQLEAIVQLRRINDLRYVNKFLEAANANLASDGYLLGCVETSSLRKQRIMNKFSWPWNQIYYFFDFFVKRVWPKLPYLKKSYFYLTGGRNRVISEMETYGRLYSCGFHLVDTLYRGAKMYFLARKVGVPVYNNQASYGPLIQLDRTGQNGKSLKVYKLRTMYPYSEYIQAYIYEKEGIGKGAKFKNDPRVTTAGKIFRKYWIDELPMLYHLVKGDIKWFGVRPISQQYFSLFPKEFQVYRSQFKPGLIPPVYVEIPNSIEDTVAIERRYLKAYEKNPFWTDFHYTRRAIVNIIFKRIRSK